jgi:hypothetical protein
MTSNSEGRHRALGKAPSAVACERVSQSLQGFRYHSRVRLNPNRSRRNRRGVPTSTMLTEFGSFDSVEFSFVGQPGAQRRAGIAAQTKPPGRS